MDFNRINQNQLNNYNNLVKQQENFTDLASGLENQNDSVLLLADKLFGIPYTKINDHKFGIIIDPTMESADIFTMLMEILLCGVKIITQNKCSLFDLTDSTDDLVYQIKSYFKCIGYEMTVKEEFIDSIDDKDTSLFRDKNDYFYEVLPKPPAYFARKEDWYVGNYKITINPNFKFVPATPVENFYLFFISKNNKIYTIRFKTIMHL